MELEKLSESSFFLNECVDYRLADEMKEKQGSG